MTSPARIGREADELESLIEPPYRFCGAFTANRAMRVRERVSTLWPRKRGQVLGRCLGLFHKRFFPEIKLDSVDKSAAIVIPFVQDLHLEDWLDCLEQTMDEATA